MIRDPAKNPPFAELLHDVLGDPGLQADGAPGQPTFDAEPGVVQGQLGIHAVVDQVAQDLQVALGLVEATLRDWATQRINSG